MKKNFFYLSLSAFLCLCNGSAFETWAGNSQKAYKKALLESMRICERVQSGHYDAVYRRKFPFQETEEYVTGHCVFSKLAKDKMLGARVSLVYEQAAKKNTAVYDGRYEVVITAEPSSAAIVTDLHQDDSYFIAASRVSGLLFKPLLPSLLSESKQRFISLQHMIKNRTTRIEKLADAYVDDRVCHVFVVHCKDREEIKNESLTIFIAHELNIPVKYIHKQIYWGSPAYEEAAICRVTLNYHDDPHCVPDARAHIPAGCNVIGVHAGLLPDRRLLAIDSVAPLWTLPTVREDTLSLKSLRGKVVLLSFWCKNCDSSLQYLRSLQQCQEKFQHQGVVVVGINTNDKYNELVPFLPQRNITYPNLLDDERVTKDYCAYVPNTFYLLDQSGKVHYVTIAQGNFPKKSLYREIKHLLKKINKPCRHGYATPIKAKT
jgi:peroxiredoxin